MLKRRRARNRKTAHISRLRQKHQLAHLHSRIAELSAEAQALRLEIAATWQVSGPYNQSCIRHLHSLIAALQDTATPEEELRRKGAVAAAIPVALSYPFTLSLLQYHALKEFQLPPYITPLR